MAVLPLLTITLAAAPVQAQQYATSSTLPAPRIERFDVVGDDRLTPGNALNFTVVGTPGAKVEMAIEGAKVVFFLDEVRAGEYSGEYTIRRKDRIASNSAVTANLRIGNRVATAKLNKPLMLAAAPATPATPVTRYCTNCAVVEAINVVQVDGDGNYLGTIGGAYIGRSIERNAKRTRHYEVAIRFDNGGSQTVTYENDPGLRVGERVKVNNGVLERDAT